jgi:hypothetical protein
MLKTAQETAQSYQQPTSPTRTRRASPAYKPQEDASDQSDDDFGPAPPTAVERRTGHGPTVPRLDDLTHRNEMRDEDRARDRSNYTDDIRFDRKTDRKAQKERLEELVPRADPGSRERQLEKKREVTSTLQSGDVEVPESDLMGDDGVDVYKRKKKEEERKKSEREIRREEISRAREAERNEKLAERREKESKTMEFLMQIAKERFG